MGHLTKLKMLQKVKRMARELDATVEKDGSIYQIIAPAGKVWSSDPGLHMLAMPWPERDEPAEWAIDVAGVTLERMAYGVEVCTAVECDSCDPYEPEGLGQ